MRGVNRVVVSGNVSGAIDFKETSSGAPCSTFKLASDRRAGTRGETLTAWIKINIYNPALVEICRDRLHKSGYVIVEGELMNRDTPHGEVTEVRAQEIIFCG